MNDYQMHIQPLQQIAKDQRKEKLITALGPKLQGDDPNLWFCYTDELANAARVSLSTAKRLLRELWREGFVEAHLADGRRTWSHKC